MQDVARSLIEPETTRLTKVAAELPAPVHDVIPVTPSKGTSSDKPAFGTAQ
jgi:hypothetical protein